MTAKPGHSAENPCHRRITVLLARCTIICICLAGTLLSGCAGGSLFNPKPLIGKDRLVFQVNDQAAGTTYFTRNIWFDGDVFRFHDLNGRDFALPKSDTLQMDVISIYDYYERPI
jgi:anthranilate/para-aminobenzoate synthase component II